MCHAPVGAQGWAAAPATTRACRPSAPAPCPRRARPRAAHRAAAGYTPPASRWGGRQQQGRAGVLQLARRLLHSKRTTGRVQVQLRGMRQCWEVPGRPSVRAARPAQPLACLHRPRPGQLRLQLQVRACAAGTHAQDLSQDGQEWRLLRLGQLALGGLRLLLLQEPPGP